MYLGCIYGVFGVFRGVLGIYIVCIHVSRVYIGVNMMVMQVYKGCIKDTI